MYFCDVTSPTQLFHVDDLIADVVIASLVFDVVAVTDKMFRSCLTNVIEKALKPDGLIVVQGSLHEKCYTVGSAVFPVMEISQDRLLAIFEECGLDLVKFELCVKYSTHYFALLKRKQHVQKWCSRKLRFLEQWNSLDSFLIELFLFSLLSLNKVSITYGKVSNVLMFNTFKNI